MSDKITFGAWLRQSRRKLDLTQQALAEEVGCARITLRRIEADALKPSKELAAILLEKVGVPKQELKQWVAFARGLANIPTKQNPLFATRSNTNLPSLISTFIGRAEEQSQILKLIQKHRLVTLTGPGGIGKTRLALKIGEQISEDYVDGVWLVELAPLNDPSLLPQTVAKVFGISTQTDTPLLDILIKFLHPKSTLLVLDNCEHLLDACAQFTDRLLKECPALKILATSREPMGITGEAIYQVLPLGLPNIQHLLDNIRDYESVRLFEERAQLVQTDFSLTIENASFITQICSRLDGIPLALELAAAKIHLFTPQQLAEQLDESFNLLIGGSRTAQPRQQTIRASVEWSWNLLSTEEKVVMQQLSVFRGGWTLTAAEAVCDGNVPGIMHSLVKKSLIMIKQESGSETRFHFHEMIRQYAREKLIEANEEEKVSARHLVYFVGLAQQAEPELYRKDQVEWLTRLYDEFDNVRAALEWATENDTCSGLQLMVATQLFWGARSTPTEASNWSTKLLERYDRTDDIRAYALMMQAQMEGSLRNFTLADSLASQGLEAAYTSSSTKAEAFGLLNRGYIFGLQGDQLNGLPLLEQGLVLYRQLGDILGQGDALTFLGIFTPNKKLSRIYFIESLKLYRELGHLSRIATVLNELVCLDIWDGNLSQSVQQLEEARLIFQQLGDQINEALVLRNRGRIAFEQTEYSQAITYYEESIRLSELSGEYFFPQWTRADMAYALLHAGDLTQAIPLFETCIRTFQEANNAIGVVYAIEGFARLYCKQSCCELAARLIGWADATREQANDLRPYSEQAHVDGDTTAIEKRIGSSAFRVEYCTGREMTVDEAILLALINNDV